VVAIVQHVRDYVRYSTPKMNPIPVTLTLQGTSSPRAAAPLDFVGAVSPAVVVNGIEVVVVVPAEPEIVALTDAKGKLSEMLELAMLQNCCARVSAEPSWVGHVDDIQATILLVKFWLFI